MPYFDNPDEAYREAQRRIADAAESGATELVLSGLGLTSVPPEIGQLASLKRVSLFSNQLTCVPSQIGQLVSLRDFMLGGNQLTSLTLHIGHLKNLERLELQQNKLTSLPTTIGELTKLDFLSLRDNQLCFIGPEIGKLSSLTWLNLHHNKLASLPQEVGQLTRLTQLWLQRNRLTALPIELRNLRRLAGLFLHDNPGLKLSPEVLGGDPRESGATAHASTEAILDFYFLREADPARPLDEVKLILVGRGGAGKTSVVDALLGNPFNAEKESTPGIALSDWMMEDCKKGPVTAHVWDFAGQVMTHALHQFFFSVRSVYVLVLTGRENSEREDAEYWLRLIKAFGTDEHGQGPPVIVALNKWDLDGCRPKVDKGALQERYPFIRKFIPLDCKTGKGVKQLKAALTKEADRLEWVHEPFPGKWDAIRRKLQTGGKRKAFLPYADFRDLCDKLGEPDAGRQDSLAEILHRLGAAINYRMDERLREATVLQPPWLTRNVYALMRKAEKLNGLLKREDIDKTLYRIKEKEMRDYLVRIMERFEIAYTRPRQNAWVVPQALPDEQPNGTEAFATIADATRLRYSYQALPEGLVPRAIVRLHDFIEGSGKSAKRWASGAILTRDGARALLRTEPQDRQVMVTVTGPKAARRKLAGLCQAELRDIHAEIRGLDPLEETEVRGAWVATATLEADERSGRSTGVSTREGTIDVDPKVELNRAYSVWPARDNSVWKPQVFISYSKSNVQQRKRLESELKILRNEGLLAGHWHDRMIDPGDDWDDTIQRELMQADVVILLVSTPALATDYITEHEIPQTLKRHNAGETELVPVILESCRWTKTALGDLNALPEKGVPLTKWRPQSEGWNSVAAGLARVFKRLMGKRK